MGTYVGKWDCPRCGTKRILGWKDGRTVEQCPLCGGPATGKWYLDNRNMELGDATEVRQAKTKRAWTCGHCSHLNDADDQDCDACGNPKDVSTDDTQIIAREYAPGNVPQTGEDTEDCAREALTDNPAATQEGFSRSARERYTAEQKAKAKRKAKIRNIILGLAGFFALLIFLLFWKKEVTVTVQEFSWEREVSIESYGPVQESSWETTPAGAYSVRSSREIHHYNTVVVGRDCHTESVSVVCGTIDNGNGTFSDRYCNESREVCVDRTVQEAVYGTKYYYTIDKWSFHHREKAKANNQNAKWPKYAGTKTNPKKYREAGRKGTYRIKVAWKGDKIKDNDVSYERWRGLQEGQHLIGYTNIVFGYWMGLKD